MAIRLSAVARNAALAQIRDLIDAGAGNGQLRIYSGNQPASPDTAASGVLLATLELVKPSFSAPAAGVMALDADPDLEANAVQTGTAGYVRFTTSTGTAVMDGSVGTAGTDFIINSVSVVNGQPVTLTVAQVNFPV